MVITARFSGASSVHRAASRALRWGLSAMAGAVQAILLPIADRHLDYARSVRDQLRGPGEASRSTNVRKIGYKIREASCEDSLYAGSWARKSPRGRCRSGPAGGDQGGTRGRLVRDVIDEARRRAAEVSGFVC